MSLLPLEIALPTFVPLCAALICLLLEIAGVKEGFRKLGYRPYGGILALLSVLLIGGVQFYLAPISDNALFTNDLLSRFGGSALSLAYAGILVSAQFRIGTIGQDGGEGYALLLMSYLFSLLLCHAKDAVAIVVLSLLWLISTVFLTAFRSHKGQSAELLAKRILQIAALMFLMSFALSTEALTINGLPVSTYALFGSLLFLGSFFPVHNFLVDALDARVALSESIFASGVFIAVGVGLLRCLFVGQDPVLWVAGITLVVLAIFAYDQQRIQRVLACLLCSQGGLLLLLGIYFPRNNPVFGMYFINLALCVVIFFCVLNVIKDHQDFASWEDYAGLGHNYPMMGAALLVALGTLVGIPFTVGFSLRLALVRAVDPQYVTAVTGLVLLSSLLAAATWARLAIFVFGKPARKSATPSKLNQRQFLPIALAILIVCLGSVPQLWAVVLPH